MKILIYEGAEEYEGEESPMAEFNLEREINEYLEFLIGNYKNYDKFYNDEILENLVKFITPLSEVRRYEWHYALALISGSEIREIW